MSWLLQMSMAMSDSHVLIDANGVAVMSGSYEEMAELERHLIAEGHTQVAVRPIAELMGWDVGHNGGARPCGK